MKKNLNDLLKEKDDFDPASQQIIKDLSFERSEIDSLRSMVATEGWKLLDKKMREELSSRILNLIKDDLVIQTLLTLLNVTATKKRTKNLEQIIDQMLPD